MLNPLPICHFDCIFIIIILKGKKFIFLKVVVAFNLLHKLQAKLAINP